MTDIGDNGTVVGSGEMSDGTSRAFKWTLGGGSVDLGTLGQEQRPVALSQDGCQMTGASEAGSGQDMHAILQNLCTP